MLPVRALGFIICIAAAIVAAGRPALAQVCSHSGPLVTCDDGRRGLLSGDAIVWADGTRSIASPPPSIVIGNQPSAQVGQGTVPPDNRNAANKPPCAILDGVTYYCY